MRELRRWLPLLAVCGLLIAVGAAASMVQLPLRRAVIPHAAGGELEQRDPLEMPSTPPRQQGNFAVPEWAHYVFFAVIIAVVLVILLVVVGAVVRGGSRFRRRSVRARPPVTAPSTVEDEVISALDAGLSELDEVDNDPRRAVIACWVRLERAAAGVGTARLAGDTSTDLVLRLLAGHNLSAPVLTGFADVYRQARYASHEVDERMRDQARTALGRLRDELTGSEKSEMSGLRPATRDSSPPAGAAAAV